MLRWIITDQERKAFKSLSNDEERDAFIEQFWLRRNPESRFARERVPRRALSRALPTPTSISLRASRVGRRTAATSTSHLASPTRIESHPGGGTYERPMEEGGGNTSTFPFEIWHYRYLEGIGDNIDIEFVDTCMCGDYHMTIDRSEKDALLHMPGAGLTHV